MAVSSADKKKLGKWIKQAREKKQPHHIDPDKCIKCGACIEKCKFGAISIQ